jgi:large subunit ribosomal protein L25
MTTLVLEAQTRTTQGKKNSKLREQGLVPAVAYGRGFESESIEVNARELDRAYKAVGHNQILNIKVGDGAAKGALIHELQFDALNGSITHADFYLVRMDETLRTEVPLHFVGESTAVYQLEGILFKNLEEVEIECLPGDLPESLEVDISVLDDFEKTISLSDLVIPKGVKLLEEDLTILIARVDAPRSDDEIAELDAELGDVVPDSVKEEGPIVVSEENEGDKDKRDKK